MYLVYLLHPSLSFFLYSRQHPDALKVPILVGLERHLAPPCPLPLDAPLLPERPLGVPSLPSAFRAPPQNLPGAHRASPTTNPGALPKRPSRANKSFGLAKTNPGRPSGASLGLAPPRTVGSAGPISTPLRETENERYRVNNNWEKMRKRRLILD